MVRASKSQVNRVYIDSCCIIDMVAAGANIITKEDREELVWYYKQLLKAGKAGDIEIITSYLTVVECRYVKNQDNKKVDTEETRRLFDSVILSGKAGIIAVEPTITIIERARDLSRTHGLKAKPFDSLHIATALEEGCVEFITTDIRSLKSDIPICKKLGLNIISATKTTCLPEQYKQTGVFDEEE